MKAFPLPFSSFLALFIILFPGCRSAKTPYSFHPDSGNKAIILTNAVPDYAASEPAFSENPAPENQTEQHQTVAFYRDKVKPVIARIQPETNTLATFAPTQKISAKQLNIQALKKIKDIKDGPIEGPWSLISGIFLGIGMALLLAALVMAIIGTSGAGTLALIGGSSFLAGSIVAIISLLKY